MAKMAGFLEVLGVKHMEIPPGATQEEIHSLLKQWNSSEDGHEAFSLSTKTASLGMNLHKACHRLVIYGIPENINTLLQVIGRVHRIGQKKVQYIWLVTQDHSYDQILRAKAVKKFLTQVLGEPEIKDFSDPDVKKLALKRAYQTAGMQSDKKRPETKEVENTYIHFQVLQKLVNQLGLRCAPHGWEDHDLAYKNTL